MGAASTAGIRGSSRDYLGRSGEVKRRGARRNGKMRGLLSKAADGVEEAIVEGPRGRRRKVERGRRGKEQKCSGQSSEVRT